MSYTASAINLRVDAPGRKDGAEELEAADVHALMSESMGNIGKPDAKARGRKGRLDWEHSVGTPPASWERPRADSVRIVEHAPVCQLAVESFKNPVSKVKGFWHLGLLSCYGHFAGSGAHASDFRQMRGTPGSRANTRATFAIDMSRAGCKTGWS